MVMMMRSMMMWVLVFVFVAMLGSWSRVLARCGHFVLGVLGAPAVTLGENVLDTLVCEELPRLCAP
jgi:hypothetical protein